MAILLVYCLCSDFINFPWPVKTFKIAATVQSMTVPITFESGCNTETYTEAKEREHSRKHEQATCLPITLIDGVMINLIKTQKNTDGEYLEEMKTFK